MSTTSPTDFAAPVAVFLPADQAAPPLWSDAEGKVLFSREAYHRLAEVGILNPDSRYELIEGVIYMMSPIGPTQGAIVRRLTQFFSKCLPDHVDCSIQLPIFSAKNSEPEPDVALLRHREDDYQTEHPTAKDVLLIVEVAHSSLSHDLGPKLELYAQSGIHEYWVVDISRQVIVVHREPLSASYQQATIVGRGGKVVPLAAPTCELDVSWLFR